MPVVSYLGPAAAGLLTGAVVIETVFSLPGLGRYFVQGALNRDYPLLLGVVVLYAALIILFNLIADLIYGWLDPRVRTGRSEEHTSELQSLMRISYAVFCLKKQTRNRISIHIE